MKKRQTIGIVIVLWMLLVTGCGISGQGGEKVLRGEDGQEENRTEEMPAEPVEISFVYADGDETGKTAMIDMVNRFNEQHENITVRIKPGNGNAYDEILKTLESVGEFPDVFETYNVAAYVRAGMLAELPEDIVALFKNPVSIGGKVYTAPQANNNTLGIIYNKKYFEENNLKEPQTYEEFKELCRRIEDMGDTYPLVVGHRICGISDSGSRKSTATRSPATIRILSCIVTRGAGIFPMHPFKEYWKRCRRL